MKLGNSFAFIALSIMASACIEGSGTGGRPIVADLVLRTQWSENPGHIITKTGWTIELTQATLALGPVTFYELGPSLAQNTHRKQTMFDQLCTILIAPAWAHPGDEHFFGGRVVGEIFQQFALDLLAEETQIDAGVRGLAGEVGSFSVVLDPPSDHIKGDSEPLHGFHAYVVGTASRDDQTIPFAGGLVIAAAGTLRQVDGIATNMLFDSDGKVVFTVHIDAWFAQAQFDRLTVQDENGQFIIQENDQVHTAWWLAARSASGFSAEWEAN